MRTQDTSTGGSLVRDAGRTTVLPRIDDSGSADGEAVVPRLVTEDRPRFDGFGTVGKGGIGEVLQARDVDIGRRVAIKRMREDKRTQTAVARFVREVRTVGQLEHPNIVTLHDVGREDDGGYYFVMNYIDGETMEAILDRLKAGDAETHRAWPFARRFEVFRQLAHAVDFAHSRGFLHRDLKPANIMIGEHGDVQIVDWGLAKRVGDREMPGDLDDSLDDHNTRTGALLGTPRYMAPEQARGEVADVRTDVFAMCLVLYEWMTLKHYLEDLDRIDEILNAVQFRPIPVPTAWNLRHQPPVPADIVWLFMAGLHKDPDRRYGSVREILDRIEERDRGIIRIECPTTFTKAVLRRIEALVDRYPVHAALVLFASVLVLLGSVLVGSSVLALGLVGLFGV